MTDPDRILRALPLIEQQWPTPEERPDIREFTCAKCASEPTCPSAWDGYNTDGDCLEEK